MNIDFKIIESVMLFVILISIQYTLNKILIILKQIKIQLKDKQYYDVYKSAKKSKKVNELKHIEDGKDEDKSKLY